MSKASKISDQSINSNYPPVPGKLIGRNSAFSLVNKNQSKKENNQDEQANNITGNTANTKKRVQKEMTKTISKTSSATKKEKKVNRTRKSQC
jgi:hypothetical protein